MRPNCLRVTRSPLSTRVGVPWCCIRYSFVSLFIFACLNICIALVEEAFFFTTERGAALDEQRRELEAVHEAMHEDLKAHAADDDLHRNGGTGGGGGVPAAVSGSGSRANAPANTSLRASDVAAASTGGAGAGGGGGSGGAVRAAADRSKLVVLPATDNAAIEFGLALRMSGTDVPVQGHIGADASAHGASEVARTVSGVGRAVSGKAHVARLLGAMDLHDHLVRTHGADV